MTYVLSLWLIPYDSDCHTSHMTMTYHHSWLLSHMTYSSITITYDLWPIPHNHHLWLIIHNSSHMSMTSHPWLCLITYDCLTWLSCLMSYALCLMSYVSWLWHLSHMTSHDHDCYSSIWPSWLLSHKTMSIHTWTPHMSMSIITDSHHPDDPFIIHDHHDLWLSSMTMTHNYHLWPLSPMNIRTVTYIYHLWPPWLMTIRIITHDLPLQQQSLMTITYDLWPMTYYVWHISPMIPTYHSWLSLTTTNHGLSQRSPMSYHHL